MAPEGQRGQHDQQGKPAWLCKSCTNKAGAPWRNAGTLTTCGKCHIHKGAPFGQNVGRGPRDSPTTRVAKGKRANDAAVRAGLDRVQKEKQALALELKALRAAQAQGPEVAGAPANAPTEDATMQDEGGEQGDKLANIRAEIKLLKGDLAAYEALDVERRERFCAHLGGYDAAVAQLQAKLEECYARQRGCRTLRQQLASAQSHEDKMAKAAKADTDALADMREKAAQLQKDIEAQAAKADKSAQDLAAAKAEVRALAAQRAAEADGSAPSAASVPSLATGADPPEGFVSVAFAEAKWQEREAAFAAQMAALQDLVAGSSHGGPASAEPSEASDTADPASLDIDFEDDSWKSVGKEARKAIAAKHRKVIVGRLATSISKVGKSASPFQKGAKKGA